MHTLRRLKNHFVSTLLILAGLCPSELHGAETLIDFENVISSGYAPLSNQVRRVLFEDCWVTAGSQIANSPSFPMSAATSGSFVARTYGTRIRFSKPVRSVKARVSPSFISYSGITAYCPVYLFGYDRKSNVVAFASIPMLGAVEFKDDIRAFVPIEVRISSEKRIAFIRRAR